MPRGVFVRVKRLFAEQGGACCYCGCQCILGNQKDRLLDSELGVDNLATLEHLYPKTDIRRMALRNVPYPKVRNVAMACRKCNNERGTKIGHFFGQAAYERQGSATILFDLFNGLYNDKFII